jgi:LmbE family N-acetylglucosaminyl deacetylase
VAIDLLVFTSGQHGTPVRDLEDVQDRALMREYELRAAADILGVRRVSLLDYVDGALGDVDGAELGEIVAREIERSGAGTILTFGPLGLTQHDDHIAVHKATVAAIEQSRWEGRLFFCLADTQVEDNAELATASPTHSIDISDFVEVKRIALACHSSQPDTRRYFLSLSRQTRAEEAYLEAGVNDGPVRSDLLERPSLSASGART